MVATATGTDHWNCTSTLYKNSHLVNHPLLAAKQPTFPALLQMQPCEQPGLLDDHPILVLTITFHFCPLHLPTAPPLRFRPPSPPLPMIVAPHPPATWVPGTSSVYRRASICPGPLLLLLICSPPASFAAVLGGPKLTQYLSCARAVNFWEEPDNEHLSLGATCGPRQSVLPGDCSWELKAPQMLTMPPAEP